MKLTDTARGQLFNQARVLDPTLGDVFQNSMEVSEQDLRQEITRSQRIAIAKVERHKQYEASLRTLISNLNGESIE